MDVRLPNGVILQNVPEGTTQAQIIAKVRQFDPEMGREMLNMTTQSMATDVPVESGLEAAMIGAGRATERFGRGARDLWARVTGDEATRAQIAEQEAESAALYQPVREQAPVASLIGESLPAFAIPMGAAGAATKGLMGLSGVSRVAPGVARAVSGPVADAALTGAALGALDTEGSAAAGAIGGTAGGLLGSAGGRIIRPVVDQATEAAQRAAQQARGLGLRLTAGQTTGSRPALLTEASLRSSPFSAGAFEAMDTANQATVNRIAAESIGETAEEVSGEVLDRAANRIGDVFESVADEPAIGLGDDFLDALVSVEREFGEAWTESPTAKKAIDKALGMAAKGQISGREALDASQRLGKDARRLWKGTSSDPLAAEALQGVKEAIDDAIVASVSPEKAARLAEARGQYRNLLLLERPGVIRDPMGGNVSLPTLSNAMRQQRGREFLRARGTDPLSQLGQVGRSFPQAVGSSGTAERLALPAVAMGLGAGVAAADSPEEWMERVPAGAALGAGLLWGAGRGYTNPLMQGYLQRGLLPLSQAGRRALTGGAARLGAVGGPGLTGSYQNR